MKWEACFCCGYVFSFFSLFAACRWWKISTKVKKAALLDSLQETVWKSTIPQQQQQEAGNKLLPHSSKTRKWEWNPALGFSPNGDNNIEMIKDSLNLLQNRLTCRYCSTTLIFALHDFLSQIFCWERDHWLQHCNTGTHSGTISFGELCQSMTWKVKFVTDEPGTWMRGTHR